MTSTPMIVHDDMVPGTKPAMDRTRSRRSRVVGVLAAALCAMAATACGDDDASGGDDPFAAAESQGGDQETAGGDDADGDDESTVAEDDGSDGEPDAVDNGDGHDGNDGSDPFGGAESDVDWGADGAMRDQYIEMYQGILDLDADQAECVVDHLFDMDVDGEMSEMSDISDFSEAMDWLEDCDIGLDHFQNLD